MDEFGIMPMPASRRAKIFAPFDAMRGFDFAIMCKNELYTDKMLLSPEEQEELDRRFSILRNLTFNGRMARAGIKRSPASAGTWTPR